MKNNFFHNIVEGLQYSIEFSRKRNIKCKHESNIKELFNLLKGEFPYIDFKLDQRETDTGDSYIDFVYKNISFNIELISENIFTLYTIKEDKEKHEMFTSIPSIFKKIDELINEK